jgi:hypothetical protein
MGTGMSFVTKLLVIAFASSFLFELDAVFGIIELPQWMLIGLLLIAMLSCFLFLSEARGTPMPASLQALASL